MSYCFTIMCHMGYPILINPLLFTTYGSRTWLSLRIYSRTSLLVFYYKLSKVNTLFIYYLHISIHYLYTTYALRLHYSCVICSRIIYILLSYRLLIYANTALWATYYNLLYIIYTILLFYL